MSRIILGTDSLSLKSLFEQSRYQITEFGSLVLNDLHSFSTDLLFIFDILRFEVLNAEDRQKMDGYIKLILVTDCCSPEKAEQVKGADLFYFYYEPASDISARNLWCLTESLLEKAVLSHRLNSYIADSFSDIVDSNLLQKQKKEIEALNEKLREISRIDYLTNLLNRRALLESFELEKRRALRCRWRLKKFIVNDGSWDSTVVPNEFVHQVAGKLDDHVGNFACLMIDIDHFKKVNDTYGHLIGDVVLRRFGELLQQKGLFRDTDVLGRYGGEEFIVLLPETNRQHALIPAQRLRQTISEIKFEDGKGRVFSVTISIGVSEFLPEEVSSEEMIKRADDALYYAKEHGRNQVCLYDSDSKTIIQTA